MANQMIALGVRGPQLPDLGAAAARYGNMMANVATARERQGVAERAAQFRQLVSSEGFDPGNPEHIRAAAALDPAGAAAISREFTDRRKSDQDYELANYVRYRNLYPTVTDEQGHQAWLRGLERMSPETAEYIRQTAPNYSLENKVRVLATADQMLGLMASQRESEIVYGRNGEIFIVNYGGIAEGQGTFNSPLMRRVPGNRPAPAAGTPAAGTPAAGTPAAGTPAAGTPAAETGLNARPGEMPRQMVGRGIRAENVPTGSPLVPPTEEAAPGLTPASAGGVVGGVQPLDMRTAPQIIQNAIQNRVIDEMHVQQLRAVFQQDPATAAQNERSLAAWMQQNQIRIQPTGEAPIQPGMRSAEYRPGMAPAPQFQQVQATAPSGQVYVPAGRATGRRPLTSPTQDPNAAGAVAAATREPTTVSEERALRTTAAERGVVAATEGTITTGRARAERLERLRGDAPRARAQVDAVLSHTRRRIDAIDRMLRARSYESIVGPIEGRVPTWAMTPGRAVAQRLLDTIINTDTIQDIIASRGQTETGGSPLGNVSNADLQLYIRAANELEQTGDENSFRQALLNLRRELVGGMTRDRRTYSDTFRELGDEMRGLELTTPLAAPQYTPAAPRAATGGNRPAAPRRTRGGAVVTNW
jgi:hypothetical protein